MKFRRYRVHAFVMENGKPSSVYNVKCISLDQAIKICTGFCDIVHYDVFDILMERHVPVMDTVNYFKESGAFDEI